MLLVFFFQNIPILQRHIVAETYWPTDSWKTATPESQGMDSGRLAEMIKLVWQEGIAIDSISIVRNGYLVLDAYNHTESEDQRHIIYSCTKSIVSTLVGIAIDKGYIRSVKQPVLDFFPDKHVGAMSAGKRAMTLEHVLMMATGLKCQDSYKYQWQGMSGMLSSNDWVQYLLDLPMIEAPGSRFEYCNGASHLLSAIIQKTTGKTAFEFAKENLFGPLGIRQITWPENRQGITIGYSEIRMRPQDMAKIGYLFLNKGIWDGKQIVSSDWVEKSTRTHISATLLPGYGYQWWIADKDLYTALGHKGQYIMVVPKKNMVAVFTSYLDGNSTFVPLELMSNFIIPAVESEKPLAENSASLKSLQSFVTKWQTRPYYIYKKDNQPAPVDPQEKTLKTYVNNELGFSVQYQENLFNIKAVAVPPVIYRRKHITGLPAFAVLVDKAPQGITLQTTGDYVIRLAKSFPGAADFNITKSKIITLENGTKAGYSELNWRIQSIHVNTVSVVAIKGDQLIGVVVSDTEENAIEPLMDVAQSLKFNQ